MTSEPLVKLTPEQKRVRIAEFCGAEWVCCRAILGYPVRLLVVRELYMHKDWDQPDMLEDWDKWTDRQVDFSVPDYLNDLNAMHEAEKVLTREQWREFICRLYLLTSPHGYFSQENWRHFLDSRFSVDDCIRIDSATAAQRADALLLTVG